MTACSRNGDGVCAVGLAVAAPCHGVSCVHRQHPAVGCGHDRLRLNFLTCVVVILSHTTDSGNDDMIYVHNGNDLVVADLPAGAELRLEGAASVVGLLSLHVAVCRLVVAIGQRRAAVAVECRAAVGLFQAQRAVLEAVGEHERSVAPSHKAAAVGGVTAGDAAVEEAVGDTERTCFQDSHEAAVGAVAIDRRCDGHVAPAVLDDAVAVGVGGDASSILVASRDGARHFERVDGRPLDEEERGAVVGCRRVVDGQRVPCADERALETVVARARHRRDAVDVGSQLYVHAACPVSVGVVGIGKQRPVGAAADEERIVCGAVARQRFKDVERDALRTVVAVDAVDGQAVVAHGVGAGHYDTVSLDGDGVVCAEGERSAGGTRHDRRDAGGRAEISRIDTADRSNGEILYIHDGNNLVTADLPFGTELRSERFARGVGLLSLRSAVCRPIVAVGQRRTTVAAECRAAVGVLQVQRAVLEAVGERERSVAPSHEAAAVVGVGAGDAAFEETVGDAERTCFRDSHEAAVGAVTISCRCDGHAAPAVLDGAVAIAVGDDAGGTLVAG